MRRTHPILELHKVDPRMLMRLEKLEGLCLAGTAVVAGSSLLLSVFPGMNLGGLNWTRMSAGVPAGALACAAGLMAATVQNSRRATIARQAMGALALLAILAPVVIGGWVAPDRYSIAAGDASGHTMSWLVQTAFICLASLLFFVHATKGTARWVADLMLIGTAWAVLTLAVGAIFGTLRVFGAEPPSGAQPATYLVLTLLTFVAVVQRAQYGSFSIFLGRGLGSRISRGILPIVLTLPLGRELLRARMTRLAMLPERYAASILAATGTMVALALLLVIAWQVRRLEWEIQSLSLRDELTGVYNLRGFQLLADQALRMAQRSRMPFSVLFVDVDNLKQINDQLGHAVGSQVLVETAEFLKTHFRETDVLGRIGGDEFAVAGQFGADAIILAEERLEGQSHETKGDLKLSLSMGYVTADPRRRETLQNLLDRADAAMYQRKRTKKLQAI